MNEPKPSNEVFIVRLWGAPSKGGHYHGLVQHVRTGQSVAVHGLFELLSVFNPYFPKDGRTGEEETSPHPGLK